MTRVGILDDEVVICETLSKYLRELGYDVLDYALTYDEAIDLLSNQQPDIMLLDININGPLTGIDFAKHLRENYEIPLIFISSYSDKNTIDTAKTSKPNGYLVKPFTKDDLYAAIEVSVNNFGTQQIESKSHKDPGSVISDAIFIKQDSLFVKVVFTDILFIKSDGVYLEIHTCDDKKFIQRETLKNMLDLLPENKFFQVHRSYIINIDHISALNSEFVVVGKEPVPISKSQKEALMQKLNLL